MKIIIKKPIITERSLQQTKNGLFTFAFERNVTKLKAKKAIEEQFGVNVTDIKMIKMPGKTKRAGKKMRKVNLSSWKKIIVRLKKDQKIPVFEISS